MYALYIVMYNKRNIYCLKFVVAMARYYVAYNMNLTRKIQFKTATISAKVAHT